MTATATAPSCVAQQSSPDAPAGQASSPTQPAASSQPNVPKTADDARAALRAAEAEHPGDTEEVAKALATAALMESAYERVSEETLAEAERAVHMAEKVKGKESSLYAYALAIESRQQMELDRPDLARPMAEEAVAIGQRTHAPVDEWSNIVAALSIVCGRQEDYGCAERTAKMQVEIARDKPERGPTFLLAALLSLSTYAYRNGDKAPAQQATDEVEALVNQRADLDMNPQWITAENQIGVYYNELGQYARSREHFVKGIALSERAKGSDDLDVAPLIANLGYSEMGLNHPEEANRDYAKAHELYVRRFGPAHSRTADIDFRYAESLHFLGRDKEAIQWALDAQQRKRRHVSLVIRLMPERQALAQAAISTRSLAAAVTIGLEHPEIDTPGVYQEVVRSRALVAEEMAMRAAGLNRQHDPAEEELEKDLEADRREVMQLEGSGSKSPSALEEATGKMENAERALAERSASFRTDERERSSDLADLRAHLPQDAVLVSYLWYERIPSPPAHFSDGSAMWYAAFIMHPDGRPIVTFELSRSGIVKDLVTRMRTSAEAEAHGGGLNSARNEREYREAGYKLRKLVWDPLLKEIGPAHQVFIVPDGVLNLVPFGSLPAGKGYLVERPQLVHVLSSERDLLPSPDEEKKEGLLAVGSPAFEMARVEGKPDGLRDASVQCDAFDKMHFNALPGSLGEVKDVSAEWERWNKDESAQLLTGAAATRAQFVENASKSRVLHVATHAFVLDQACGNGNPLLHSGLVFAGANKSRAASVLTAQQIASLDLHGVDWAVLSACNSGYGELQDGEGVLGLERSFRVAGARSVVMALWPVDDSDARSYMHVLYAERFGRHESTAEAMWSASRTILARRRAAGRSTHPWYWAGFVAAGSWQ